VVALTKIVRSDNRPATASLHSATPKRKNVPCFSVFRGGGFFLNGKDIFLFGVLPVKIFRQCGGASIRTRFCENYFLGIWIFAKPRLIFGGSFPPAERVLGNECGRACISMKKGTTQNVVPNVVLKRTG